MQIGRVGIRGCRRVCSYVWLSCSLHFPTIPSLGGFVSNNLFSWVVTDCRESWISGKGGAAKFQDDTAPKFDGVLICFRYMFEKA